MNAEGGARGPWRIAALVVLLLLLNLTVTPAAAATYDLSLIWEHRISSEDLLVMATTPDLSHILVGGTGGKVYYVAFDGTEEWNITIPGATTVNGTIIRSSLLLAYSAGTVYSLNSADGSVLWSYSNLTDTNPILGMGADSAGANLSYVTRENTYILSSAGGFRDSIPRYGAGRNQSVSVSPDGVSVVVGSGDHVVAYKPAQTQNTGPMNFSIIDVAQTGSGVTDYNVNLTVRSNVGFMNQFGDDWKRLEVYDDYEPATGFANPLPFMVKVFDQTQHTIELWMRMTIPTASNNTIYVVENPTRTYPLSNANTTFPFYEDFEGQTLLNTSRWASTDLAYTYPMAGKLSIKGAGGVNRPTVDALISLYPNNTQYRDLVTFINISIDPVTAGALTGMSDVMGAFFHHTGGDADGYDMSTVSSKWYREIVVAGVNTGTNTGQSVTTSYRYFAIQSNDTATGYWNYTPGTSGYQLFGQYAFTPTAGSFLHPFVQDNGGTLANASVEEILVAHVNLTGTTVTETIRNTAASSAVIWGEHWHYFDDYTDAVPKSVIFDSTGGWVGVSGQSHNKTPYSAITGFGTPYTYTSVSGMPTARVRLSGAASFGVEGRGSGIFDVIRLDGTRVGTYTAGGTINGVDISNNGLWAAAGSADGILYLFGKASSSSWQLIDSTDPVEVVNAVALDTDGGYVVSARSGGYLALYQINTVTAGSFYQTLHFVKDGNPAVGYVVKVEDGGPVGAAWTTIIAANPTDSNGDLTFAATAGHYYRITVDGQTSTIMASTTYPTLYVSWESPPTRPEYGAFWNVTNETIEMYYRDGVAVPITYEIKRSDTGVVVWTHTETSTGSNLSWRPPTPPAGTAHTYQVRITANRPTGTAGGTYYLKAGEGQLIPFLPLDKTTTNILLMMFLMIMIALGGYTHAPVLTLGTTIAAAFFTYVGWMTIPWYWLLLCLLLAFLSMVGRGGGDM